MLQLPGLENLRHFSNFSPAARQRAGRALPLAVLCMKAMLPSSSTTGCPSSKVTASKRKEMHPHTFLKDSGQAARQERTQGCLLALKGSHSCRV